MNNQLLEDLYNRIDLIKGKSKLIFFKGFDSEVLMEIFKKYPRFYEGSYFSNKGIDIEGFNKERLKVMSALSALLIAGEETYSGIYEEFIFLSTRLNGIYDGNIIVVENNIYDELYPNPYIIANTELLEEYMKLLNKEQAIPNKEELVIEEYISNVTKIENDIYISYMDRSDEIPVKKLSLIDRVDLSIDPIEAEGLIDYIEYTSSNRYELISLKRKILNKDIPIHSNINIVTEKSIIKSTKLSNALKTLIIIAGDDYIINLFYVSKFTREVVRKDFKALLNKYWKSNEFRMLKFYENPDESINKVNICQDELIETIVMQVEVAQKSDDYSDIFITAPTGSGKSALYQIPAIYLAKKYNLITIVVSPLKALMIDQVRQLKDKGIVNVEYINSDLTQREKENVIKRIKDGNVSILYASPEFLLAYDIRNIIGEDRKLGLLIVDEAHLVTTWGRDFRVDYWYLGTYLRKLRESSFFDIGNFVVASFTATAVYGGNDDMVYETISSLNMRTPIKYLGNTRRDNIDFDIRKWEVHNSYQAERQQKSLEYIVECIDKNKKTIVYAPYRRHIDELLDLVPREYGHKVVKYYGGLDSVYKDIYEEKFRDSEANVMIATKAFGMGVDISDVEVVYHHAPTGNLCDYIQEIGRSGRKESMVGVAVQDFNRKDLNFSKILYGLSAMKQYQLKEIIRKLYSIYKKERRRNFLINAETFRYLFPNERNYENKIKNALLLIEKDLFNKYTYQVIIVRPKSLFSKAYAVVPESINCDFEESKYYKYAVKISKGQCSRNSCISIQDIGPIYKFDLKRLWEDHYSDLSFPLLKKKFYDRNLFDFKEAIIPRYKLTITLEASIYDSKTALEQNMSFLLKCFNKQKNGFFTRDDFNETLKEYYPNDAIRKKITNTFIDLFVIEYGEDNRNKFIIRRTSNGKKDREEFRLHSKLYNKIFRDIINNFNNISNNIDGDKKTIDRYLAIKTNSHYMMLAYVIEAFSLGAYDVRGGESPEIFVRVNDPGNLRLLSSVSRRYSNDILRDIKERQKRSSNILERFFTEIDGNEKRWDFIEEYFLGKINID